MKQKIMSLCCILSLLLAGCSAQTNSLSKVKDLDFTVVEEADIPSELQKIISEKKQNPFKLSYTDSEFSYIVMGYGEQKTGGYSITVRELYETDNAVCFHTELIGPGKDESVSQSLTYPYIVVKTEFIEKNVVFE